MPVQVAHAQAEGAFVKANGIELCYDSFGDPAAPPLLLIMGLAAQMIAWDATSAARRAWTARACPMWARP